MGTVLNQLNPMLKPSQIDTLRKMINDMLNYGDSIVELEHDQDHTCLGISVRLASYGDYSSTTMVEVANHKYLLEKYPSLVTVNSGYYGSQELIILGSALLRHNSDIKDDYDSLSEYPLFDDEKHSEVCQESYDTWWQDEQYTCNKDFLASCVNLLTEKQYDLLEDWLDDSNWDIVSQVMREYHEKHNSSGEFYIDESSQGVYVRFEPNEWDNSLLVECIGDLDCGLITLDQAVEQYNQEEMIDSDMVVYAGSIELYSVLAGLPGCLPNYSSLHTSYNAALEDGVQYIDPNHDRDHTVIWSKLADFGSWQFNDGTYLSIENLTYLPT